MILLMSPMSTHDDYEKLTEALGKALAAAKRYEPKPDSIVLPLPGRAMSIRDAVFAPSEEIPIDEAEGRICAAVKVPCPPAVPIAASGEVIDRRCIDVFRRYGIGTVNVVRR